jgi:hypothetical protein
VRDATALFDTEKVAIWTLRNTPREVYIYAEWPASIGKFRHVILQGFAMFILGVTFQGD